MPIDPKESLGGSRIDYRSDQGRAAIAPPDELSGFLRSCLGKHDRSPPGLDSDEELHLAKMKRAIKVEELAAVMAEQEARRLAQTPQPKLPSSQMQNSPESQLMPQKPSRVTWEQAVEDAETQQANKMADQDDAAENRPEEADAVQEGDAGKKIREAAECQKKAEQAIQAAQAVKAKAEQDFANIMKERAATMHQAEAEAAQQATAAGSRLNPEEGPKIQNKSAEAMHEATAGIAQGTTAAASALDLGTNSVNDNIGLSGQATDA